MKILIKPTVEKTGWRVVIIESLESKYGEVNKITTSPIQPTVHRAISWVQHKLYLDSIRPHPMGGVNIN